VAFDAFISYSSKDKTTADAACAVLEGAGIRCWIAPRDIRPGLEYGAAIIHAIDHCQAMVIVFSASANESRQIHREIERAVAKGVPILPVRIEEVTPTKSMEYFLGAIHWLDALNPPLERHLHQLAETLKAMLKIEAGLALGSPSDAGMQPGNVAAEAAAPDAARRATAAATAAPNPAAAATPSRPRWLLPAIGATGLVALIAASAQLYRLAWHAPPGAVSSPSSAAATLRQAVQPRNLLIGGDVSARFLRGDLFYARTLGREYNLIGSGGETWFSQVQKSRTEADFSNADAVVEFAAANGMKLRGTALVNAGPPAWLAKANLSQAENTAIFKEFVQTMLRRYRGRIYSWDISWGTFDNLGKLRQTFWTQTIGDDYVERLVSWAHEADPQAKLFIHNNYDTGPRAPRAESTYDLLRNLKARGVPIDGVALGTHLLLDQLPSMQDEIFNMNRLAALGLEMHVVEFEVSMPMPPTEQNLQRQAAVYADYLGACLAIPNCRAFLIGGVSDKDAFAPNRWPGMNVGAAMPFDAVYKPKPAFQAMLDALNRSSNPNVSGFLR
jgi:endo-1,4-beta-xylanase